jgi:hypothetical protein
VALCLVVMLGFVAMGVDISSHTRTRQKLWDTLDASALAGSTLLPDGVAAYQAALDYADANMPGLVPDIKFWCVVGIDASGPNASHIPAMCNPGPPPYNVGTYPGLHCNSRMCLIPCNPLSPEHDTCNTMSVSAERDVAYAFAPVIGTDQGSTGVLTSAACKGPCGAEIDAPGDIALVVDRTGSMGNADMNALVAASRTFLEGLTPSLHDVALGTLGRSNPNGSCPTRASTNANSGPWVAVGLRNDYDLTDNDPPDNPPDLNVSSDLVRGINCLPKSSTGTNLGDPLKAAGDHLVANGRPDVPNAVVFMTDGEANKPYSNGNCNYAKTKASEVKSAGVIVVTIAYRLQGVDCEGTPATTVLADMASDPQSGPPTADDGGDGPGGLPGGCENAPEIASENADGDLFFCAPSPGQLSAVFSSASASILAEFSDRTILIRPPA